MCGLRFNGVITLHLHRIDLKYLTSRNVRFSESLAYYVFCNTRFKIRPLPHYRRHVFLCEFIFIVRLYFRFKDLFSRSLIKIFDK